MKVGGKDQGRDVVTVTAVQRRAGSLVGSPLTPRRSKLREDYHPCRMLNGSSPLKGVWSGRPPQAERLCIYNRRETEAGVGELSH